MQLSNASNNSSYPKNKKGYKIKTKIGKQETFLSP